MFDYTLNFHLRPEELEFANTMQKDLISSISKLDDYVSATYTFTVTLLPLFVSALSLVYVFEKKGYFHFKHIRENKYKKILIKDILCHALLNSITIYLAYLIFLFVGIAFNRFESDVDRPLLNYIFGRGFYFSNMVLYHIIDGFIRFFIFTFVYSVFSFSISLCSTKYYYSMLSPIVYYFFTSIIFGIGFKYQFLSPTFTQGFPSYGSNLTIGEVLTPLLIPFIFSIGVVVYSCIRNEKVCAFKNS